MNETNLALLLAGAIVGLCLVVAIGPDRIGRRIVDTLEDGLEAVAQRLADRRNR